MGKFNPPLAELFSATGGKVVLQSGETTSSALISSLDTVIADIVTESSNAQLVNNERGFRTGSIQYR